MDQYVTTMRPRPTTATLSLGQRTAYIGGGIALAAASIRPRPNVLLTLLAFATGAYLAWRGVEGNDPVKGLIAEASTAKAPPGMRAL